MIWLLETGSVITVELNFMREFDVIHVYKTLFFRGLEFKETGNVLKHMSPGLPSALKKFGEL